MQQLPRYVTRLLVVTLLAGGVLLESSPALGLAESVDLDPIECEGSYKRIALSDAGTLIVVASKLHAWTDVGGDRQQLTIQEGPAGTQHVVYKPLLNGKGRLVLVDREAGVIRLLDDNGKHVATHDFKTQAISVLAAPSDPRVPYLIVCTLQNREGRLILLDALTLEEIASSRLDGRHSPMLDQSDAPRLVSVSSADGSHLFLKETGVSPTGRDIFRLLRGADGELQVELVIDEHESVDGYVPDDSGQRVAYNGILYDGSGTEIEQKLGDVQALGSFPSADVLLTRKGLEYLPHRWSDGKLLGRIKFDLGGGRLSSSRRILHTSFAVNQTAGLFVHGTDEHVYVAEIADLDLPAATPAIAHLPETPASITVGQVWSTPVSTESGTKVTLREGPEGLKLNNGKLEWTPNAAAVGSHEIELTVERSGAEPRTHVTWLTVSRPAIEVPFPIASLSASADSSLAVAMSVSEQHRSEPTHVATIDVASRELLATMTRDQPIRKVVIGGGRVFAAEAVATAVSVYDAKTLKREQEVFLPAQPLDLAVVGGRLIVALSLGEAAIFDAETLKPIYVPEADQRRISTSHGRGQQLVPERIHQGWMWQQVRYDQSLKQAQLLYKPASLHVAPPRNSGPLGRGNLSPSSWGVQLSGDRLMGTTGQIIGQIPGQSMVMPRHPLAVSLEMAQGENRGTQSLSLKISDLVTARTVGTEDLGTISSWRRTSHGFSPFEVGENHLLIIESNRVLPIALSRFEQIEVETPLRIDSKTPRILLGDEAEAALVYEVVGGEGETKLTLENEVEGVSFDAGSSTVTLDSQKLRGAAEKIVSAQLSQNVSPRGGTDLETAMRQNVEQRLAYWKSGLQMPGLEIKGVPVCVPISLKVTDARQKQASLDHFVIIDVPVDGMLDEMIKKRVADFEQAKERQEAARAEYEERMRQRRTETEDVEALKRRIEELERANAKLEAQVEVLKQMISEKND